MASRILALLEHPEHIADVRNCLVVEGGHKLSVATSFREAKAILEETAIDLIISDVHLENGGNVFDFLKWIRSQERFRFIPFVLFSLEPTTLAKYLSDGVRAAARQLGAHKYISMDTFDPDLLLKELAELLPPGAAVQVVTTAGE